MSTYKGAVADSAARSNLAVGTDDQVFNKATGQIERYVGAGATPPPATSPSDWQVDVERRYEWVNPKSFAHKDWTVGDGTIRYPTAQQLLDMRPYHHGEYNAAWSIDYILLQEAHYRAFSGGSGNNRKGVVANYSNSGDQDTLTLTADGLAPGAQIWSAADAVKSAHIKIVKADGTACMRIISLSEGALGNGKVRIQFNNTRYAQGRFTQADWKDNNLPFTPAVGDRFEVIHWNGGHDSRKNCRLQIPPGHWMLNRSLYAQYLSGCVTAGTGKGTSILTMTRAHTPIMKHNGTFGSRWESLAFTCAQPTDLDENGVAVAMVDHTWDSTGEGLDYSGAAQGDVFHNCFFEGKQDVQNQPNDVKRLLQIGLTVGGNSMSSEHVISTCHFNHSGEAALKITGGGNALNTVLINCNFNSNPCYGVWCHYGNVQVFGGACQNNNGGNHSILTHNQLFRATQNNDHGFDFAFNNSAASHSVITGVRSESMRMVRAGNGHIVVLRGCQNGTTVDRWFPSTRYSVDDVVAAQPTARYRDGRYWRVATAGVTGAVKAIPAGGLTRSGSTASVETTTAHGLATGDTVRIVGANEAEYNGVVTVSVTDATHFTYPVSGTPASPATGVPAIALNVVSVVRSGSTVTVTTGSPHGYAVNDHIYLGGATPQDYNGTWKLTAVTSKTFNFAIGGTPSTPATGTILVGKEPAWRIAADHTSITDGTVVWASLDGLFSAHSGFSAVQGSVHVVDSMVVGGRIAFDRVQMGSVRHSRVSRADFLPRSNFANHASLVLPLIDHVQVLAGLNEQEADVFPETRQTWNWRTPYAGEDQEWWLPTYFPTGTALLWHGHDATNFKPSCGIARGDNDEATVGFSSGIYSGGKLDAKLSPLTPRGNRWSDGADTADMDPAFRPTNAAGGDMWLCGGKPTGAGLAGSIKFMVGQAGTSGSSVAAFVEAHRIDAKRRLVSSAAQAEKRVTLTDGATVATDASLGNYFTLDAAGSRTIANPTNPTDGQELEYRIKNATAGAIATTWGSEFRFTNGAWSDPGAGLTRIVRFRRHDGLSKWEEVCRTGAF